MIHWPVPPTSWWGTARQAHPSLRLSVCPSIHPSLPPPLRDGGTITSFINTLSLLVSMETSLGSAYMRLEEAACLLTLFRCVWECVCVREREFKWVKDKEKECDKREKRASLQASHVYKIFGMLAYYFTDAWCVYVSGHTAGMFVLPVSTRICKHSICTCVCVYVWYYGRNWRGQCVFAEYCNYSLTFWWKESVAWVWAVACASAHAHTHTRTHTHTHTHTHTDQLVVACCSISCCRRKQLFYSCAMSVLKKGKQNSFEGLESTLDVRFD